MRMQTRKSFITLYEDNMARRRSKYVDGCIWAYRLILLMNRTSLASYISVGQLSAVLWRAVINSQLLDVSAEEELDRRWSTI